MRSVGVFSQWQAVYAEQGISTFPVNNNKCPVVKGFLDIGRGRSRALVSKFGDSQALGFVAGARNGITVLDIDTKDERVLSDALARHGDSPIVIRTASGKFHVWYAHNRELRMIRPWDGLEIDLLGEGLVVAPPSVLGSGHYEIIKGSLDDLEMLPKMRGLNGISEGIGSISKTPGNGGIKEGQRNLKLFRHCMYHARYCDLLDDLIDVARTYNEEILQPPLNDAEVLKVARSAWEYEERGQNWVGHGRIVAIGHNEIDGLLDENPDAFILLTKLRRHHWNHDFVVANKMSDIMPGGRWTIKRFASARRELEQRGYLKQVRPASRKNGPALYRWP
jgi:hypothetical protein